MRPRSEVREAIAAAAQSIAEAGRSVTWRDLVPCVPGINPASPAEVRLVRRTVENMARSGELERVGRVPVPGSAKPMTGYKPRSSGWVTQGHTLLDGVVRGWRVA